MRYVLDTDVIVAAMRSPSGASAALLLAALDRRFTLVLGMSREWVENGAINQGAATFSKICPINSPAIASRRIS